jgi:hypothetical protein
LIHHLHAQLKVNSVSWRYFLCIDELTKPINYNCVRQVPVCCIYHFTLTLFIFFLFFQDKTIMSRNREDIVVIVCCYTIRWSQYVCIIEFPLYFTIQITACYPICCVVCVITSNQLLLTDRGNPGLLYDISTTPHDTIV